MIGIWGDYTAVFLRVFAILSLVVFGLPIFLAPMRWARAFGWRLPEDPDLALYFGRCLGALACLLGFAALYAAGVPSLHRFYLQILIGSAALLGWVHVLGAVQGVQPITETVEIVFWGALIVLALCFYP